MNAIILLAITGLISMFSGIFRKKHWALPIILVSCVASIFILAGGYHGDYSDISNNMLTFDKLAIKFSIIIIFILMFVFMMCQYYYSEDIEHLSDIFALFVFSSIGAILLVSFQNLTMLFLGTEILSIPLYILAASNRKNLASNEAGLKYYLLGSFATCFMLLGITLIYGAYGSFDLGVIASARESIGESSLFTTGLFLVICAFIFKIGAVPFHFWAPDVYHGAPTVLTAFVSTVVKVAIFGALIKFVSFIGLQPKVHWVLLLTLVSIASMVFGNLASLKQENFKRLMAYTGIANAGFVLIAYLVLQHETYVYVIYNLTVYSVAAIIALSIYSTVKTQTNIDTISGMTGLLTHNKLLGVAMIICMLSFAGIPPLAGFFAKYFILVEAIKYDYTWIAVVGVLVSVLAAYNYLRIIASIGQRDDTIPTISLSLIHRAFLIAGIVFLVVSGLMPEVVISWLR